MKAKIIRDKRAKETRIDYYKVDDKSAFRFNVLKKVLENIDCDATLIIDTNKFTQRVASEDIKKAISASKVPYTSFPVRENSTLFLGIKTDIIKKKKGTNEMLFLLDISSENFGKKLFDELFQYCDLAFGIKRSRPPEEIGDTFKTLSSNHVMFNKDFFEHSIYDSILCTSLRSTIDIQNYVKEQKT